MPLRRRQFLQSCAASSFAFHFVPKSCFGANDRIQVAAIGIGGKGAGDVRDVAKAGGTIVSLCDVDEKRRVRGGQDVVEEFPQASFYHDYRQMLDREDKRIDAVLVSTPDHTHCHPAVTAMRMGKHVYCQKPLARTIAEARLMADTARQAGVATQMGNQAHAGEPIRRAVELIRAGLIGKVREVHAWTNRPVWPQGLQQLPTTSPVPDTLKWDLWLGPAASRPYSDAYCPFNWRGWWDFGTGALGDMGCHIMDMPYWALDLQTPRLVTAESVGNSAFSGPEAATVTYQFPAGKYSNDLKFCWYDGNRLPPAEVVAGVRARQAIPQRRKEPGIAAGAELSAAQVQRQFDLVMIGEKGRFFFQRSKDNWQTVPANLLEDQTPPSKSIPRVENEDAEWLTACRGGAPALSNFERSGPFTEVVLLGNLAVRLGQPIRWDQQRMSADHPQAAKLIGFEYRDGWRL